MTSQTDSESPATAPVDSEFDLDIRIVESAPVVAELMQITDDECGKTCETACPNTGC